MILVFKYLHIVFLGNDPNTVIRLAYSYINYTYGTFVHNFELHLGDLF